MAEHNDQRTPALNARQEIARDLNSGAIRLLRGMRNVDRESGLTPARLSALSVLVFGGPATVGRLAQAEDVASPTMTRIVDGLSALGLVERTAHPDSGRAVVVTATAAGHALMKAAARRRFDAITIAMAGLSEPDQDALRAAALPLRRLAAIIRQGNMPSTSPSGPAGSAAASGSAQAGDGAKRSETRR